MCLQVGQFSLLGKRRLLTKKLRKVRAFTFTFTFSSYFPIYMIQTQINHYHFGIFRNRIGFYFKHRLNLSKTEQPQYYYYNSQLSQYDNRPTLATLLREVWRRTSCSCTCTVAQLYYKLQFLQPIEVPSHLFIQSLVL